MCQRPGADVGQADHLQHPRHVGVPRLSLDAVGEVEDHAGPLTLDDARHELFEPVDQVLIALEGRHLMAALLQGVADALDRPEAVFLSVRQAEQVDHALAFAVVDDGDFHIALLGRGSGELARLRRAGQLKEGKLLFCLSRSYRARVLPRRPPLKNSLIDGCLHAWRRLCRVRFRQYTADELRRPMHGRHYPVKGPKERKMGWDCFCRSLAGQGNTRSAADHASLDYMTGWREPVTVVVKPLHNWAVVPATRILCEVHWETAARNHCRQPRPATPAGAKSGLLSRVLRGL